MRKCIGNSGLDLTGYCMGIETLHTSIELLLLGNNKKLRVFVLIRMLEFSRKIDFWAWLCRIFGICLLLRI